jgi:glutathione S-transferase
MILYGAMASRAHRVVWMLKECRAAFDHVPIDFLDGSTRRAECLAINPNGRVPVLDDHGFVLFESLAINLYLAKVYGGALGPAGIREDALMTQWSFWVATEVEKPLLFTAANRALFAEGSRDEEQARAGLAKLDRPLKVLDAHLSRHGHVVADRFTVADLNIATVLDLAPQCGISLGGMASCPGVARTVPVATGCRRLEGRPLLDPAPSDPSRPPQPVRLIRHPGSHRCPAPKPAITCRSSTSPLPSRRPSRLHRPPPTRG